MPRALQRAQAGPGAIFAAFVRMARPSQRGGTLQPPPMTDIAYRSTVRVERRTGPLRLAYLPAETEPVVFGTHGPIAKHYGVEHVAEPHATTIDYIVAAAGG